MSQPTRGRTTAARSTRSAKPVGKAPARPDEQPPAQAQTAANPLAPETLARTLRAVAAELERDPALARRVAEALSAPETSERARSDPAPAEPERTPRSVVNQSFRPRLITGTDPALGRGIPDPHAIYARGGEAGLRSALAELRLGTLRAILREHRLDPGGKLARHNDAAKLRAAILAAVRNGK